MFFSRPAIPDHFACDVLTVRNAATFLYWRYISAKTEPVTSIQKRREICIIIESILRSVRIDFFYNTVLLTYNTVKEFANAVFPWAIESDVSVAHITTHPPE